MAVNLPKLKLDVRPKLHDLSRATAPQGLKGFKTETVELEAVARPRISEPSLFEGREGFDQKHVGFDVELPVPKGRLKQDVLPVGGDASGRLDYQHFSVVMSGSRRVAMFVAVNIEGARSASIPRSKDTWYLDGRIPVEAQIGEELYVGNRLDRGHLVRREDPNWGADARVANADTFHFTNCCPQMDIVNQKTWLGLENYILRNARAWKERCTVFTGPVLGKNDVKYRGVLIPKAFWKVVAFLTDDGEPAATAYVVEQKEELKELEAAFGAYKTYQRSIKFIQALTGLSFGELSKYDGFSNEEVATETTIAAELRSPADIRLPTAALKS